MAANFSVFKGIFSGVQRTTCMILYLTGIALSLTSCEPRSASQNAIPSPSNRGFEHRREPEPAERIVDHIEGLLAHNSCIGDLNRWERLYAYGINHETRELNTNVVQFHLRQAGRYDFRSGRRTVQPLEWLTLDNRIYNFVSGNYNIVTTTLEVEYCGPNEITER